ncbi:MAG: hypothetical protein WBQ79_03025 [Acidobacteriaceae bacterium]
MTNLEGMAITFGVWALLAHFFPEPHWARVLPMFLSEILVAAVKDRMPVNGWIALTAVAGLAIAAHIPLSWAPMMAIAGAYLLFFFARIRRSCGCGD